MVLATRAMGFIFWEMALSTCTVCHREFERPHNSNARCGRCRGKSDRDRARECIEAKARLMATKARLRAKNRGQVFTVDALSIVTQWYRQAGRCYFSGRPMTLTPGPRCVSLDRLDNRRGYTVKNIVLAAMRVNAMKSDLTEAEFRDWCEAVAANSRPETSEKGGVKPPEELDR
jgi:hypothetical protein